MGLMEHGNVSYTNPIHQSVFVLAARVLLLQFIVGLGSIVVNLVFVLPIGTGVQETLLITALSIGSMLIQTLDAVILIYVTHQLQNMNYNNTPD